MVSVNEGGDMMRLSTFPSRGL
uniref:Uncharacterized protein n=1 Tax=Anguilla anguilla TaxID=7936 RepID=A0A0E9U4E7_ANGAN